MDAPTNYDDDIPEWWGAGYDGPPSSADDSESEDDESNEPSESKIHKIQYSPTGWEGENDEGFVWGGPSSGTDNFGSGGDKPKKSDDDEDGATN